MNRRIVSFMLCSFCVFSLFGSGQSPASPSPGATASVVIVELFTSEGCSSCPPADSLLSRIHLTKSSAGQFVVGLSEHVTYWNNLGWRDPFSQDVFTRRQERYASRFSLSGPYTPQMLVNGRHQFNGSDVGALRQALHAEESRQPKKVVILSAKRETDGVDLRFSVSPGGYGQVDIYAALTDDLDQSSVLRGENSGRSLQHVAVVRSLTRTGTEANGKEMAAKLALPKGFDQSEGHHIVVFAQEPGQGAILGAGTIALH